MRAPAEQRLQFPCFGGTCAVHVGGYERSAAEEVAAAACERLLMVHNALSRFEPDSELSRLNAAQDRTVPASPLMRRFASAVVEAGRRSSGLVDATRLGALEEAGYRHSMTDVGAAATATRHGEASPPRPAWPHPDRGWEQILVDDEAGTVTRPPGLRLDSGGLAKGLAADLVGATLAGFATFAVNCAGDLRIGGSAGAARAVFVDDPFGGEPVAELAVADGAAATSGIGRRSWIREDGRSAHHLIDPHSGEPAFTGVVQVTALAPTALRAEVLAKTALLRGPEGASELVHGGVMVLDDGTVVEVDPRLPLAALRPTPMRAPA